MDLDSRKMGLIRHGGHEPTEMQPGCLIGFYFAAHWVPTARNSYQTNRRLYCYQ